MSTVSIIVCAYNEGEYIGDCISSLINQSYKDIEIVIVDDGSTDNTWSVLSRYAVMDSRVVIFQHEKNLGKVAAQNSAFQLSRGDFIAICGADDWYPLDRIEAQINFLIENSVDFTFGNMMLSVTDDATRKNYDIGLLYGGPLNLSRDWRDILLGVSASCGTAFFNRKVANNIYPIPADLAYEDRWITAIALMSGNVLMQDRVLGTYRQHSGNSFGLLCTNLGYHDFLDKYKSVYLRNLVVNSRLAERFSSEGVDLDRISSIKKLSDYLSADFVYAALGKRFRYFFVALSNKLSGHYLLRVLIGELYVYRVWSNARKRYKKFEWLRDNG